MARDGSDSTFWILGLGLLGLGAYILGKKAVDQSQAAGLSLYLQSILPANAVQYADDIAAGAVGTIPDDFVDPNGGDPLQRWGADLAAVGQYESGFGTLRGYTPLNDPTGWGDRGNAFGFFQLDKRFHNAFITSPDAQDPNQTVGAQANYAGGLLASNWAAFSYIADPLAREQLMFITYNASLARVQALIQGGASIAAVDATTTPRNGTYYGANVEALLSSWV